MSGPTDFKDISVSPNPNQGMVLCSFKVYQEGNTTIGIYDVVGREQIEVVNEHHSIGSYSKVIDLGRLEPGVYLAVYKSQDRTSTKRLIKTN
jgi:hypothetical protein